jgi:hypothetical protein
LSCINSPPRFNVPAPVRISTSSPLTKEHSSQSDLRCHTHRAHPCSHVRKHRSLFKGPNVHIPLEAHSKQALSPTPHPFLSPPPPLMRSPQPRLDLQVGFPGGRSRHRHRAGGQVSLAPQKWSNNGQTMVK